MAYLRPIDLARRHGISTQAVRNYERDGCLPSAERTESGYRRYTEVHAAALRAYLALVAGHGYAAGGDIMRLLHAGRIDAALATLDRSHTQLQHDRATLDAVEEALQDKAIEVKPEAGTRPPLRIGGLARGLGVTTKTLRSWEAAGILVPGREGIPGHRVYHAGDVRDAELARMLRRGGYGLDHIATVVEQVRTAGGTEALYAALDDWRGALVTRGLSMLDASADLSRYLAVWDGPAPSE